MTLEISLIYALPALTVLITLSYLLGRWIGEDRGARKTFAYLRTLQEKYPDFAAAWARTTWRENPETYAQELAEDEARKNKVLANHEAEVKERIKDEARKLYRDRLRHRIRS